MGCFSKETGGWIDGEAVTGKEGGDRDGDGLNMDVWGIYFRSGLGVFFGFDGGFEGKRVWVIPKSLEGSYILEEVSGRKG